MNEKTKQPTQKEILENIAGNLVALTEKVNAIEAARINEQGDPRHDWSEKISESLHTLKKLCIDTIGLTSLIVTGKHIIQEELGSPKTEDSLSPSVPALLVEPLPFMHGQVQVHSGFLSLQFDLPKDSYYALQNLAKNIGVGLPVTMGIALSLLALARGEQMKGCKVFVVGADGRPVKELVFSP